MSSLNILSDSKNNIFIKVIFQYFFIFSFFFISAYSYNNYSYYFIIFSKQFENDFPFINAIN